MADLQERRPNCLGFTLYSHGLIEEDQFRLPSDVFRYYEVVDDPIFADAVYAGIGCEPHHIVPFDPTRSDVITHRPKEGGEVVVDQPFYDAIGNFKAYPDGWLLYLRIKDQYRNHS